MKRIQFYALSLLIIVPVTLPALEGPLLQCAQALGADCEAEPSISSFGSFTPDETAESIYCMLYDKKSIKEHTTPLVSGSECDDYREKFLQVTISTAQKSSQAARLKLMKTLDHVRKEICEKNRSAAAFYCLRILAAAGDGKEETKLAQEAYADFSELFENRTFPQTLASISALEKYRNTLKENTQEAEILNRQCGTLYAEAAVHCINTGAFQAGEAALEQAEKLLGAQWKPTASFLHRFLTQRKELGETFGRLKGTWKTDPKSAYELSLLFLGTFRSYEKAFDIFCASGDNTLKQLATLLQMHGGLMASAELVRTLAGSPSLDRTVKTGLKLLAIDLYRRASPGKQLSQVTELSAALDQLIDPKLGMKLNPRFAARGLTMHLISDPPKSYVYVDYALQAVPGSFLTTPCRLFGIAPGTHTITLAGKGKQDSTFNNIEARHGMILTATHRNGRSRILATGGKNLFLNQNIAVKGPEKGHATLFDGQVKPLSTKLGFASNKHPCVFTLALPRPVQLSAIRMKLWDGDKRTYKYKLDISPRGRHFLRVADLSNGVSTKPSGWQNILFPVQPVRVIKLHCIYNSANTSFQVLEIEGHPIAHPELMTNPISTVMPAVLK